MILGGLPSYYHYFWQNAAEEDLVRDAQNLLQTTKDTILSQYIQKYNTAFSNFQDQSGFALTDEESAVLDFAAKGTLTAEDLTAAMQSPTAGTGITISGSDVGGGAGLIQAVYELNMSIQESDGMFTDLSNLMDAFNNATDLYQQVENAIITVGGNIRNKMNTRSTVVKEVVQNILNSPDGSTWNKAAKGYIQTLDIDKRINQWLVLLYALVTNSIPKGGKEAVKQAILRQVRERTTILVNTLGKVGTMLASTVGTAQLLKSVKNSINSRSVNRHKTSKGGIGYSIEMKNDAALQAAIDDLTTTLSSAKTTNTAGKKVSIKYPNTSVGAVQTVWSDSLEAKVSNVSVKNQTSIKTLNSDSKRIKNLTVQSTAPLGQVLTQQLGISGSTMSGLLQIAIAQGSGMPDVLWTNLRNYLKQALIVPALTNLNINSLGEGDLYTMIKINDYLIPMPQFLNYVQAMLTRQSGILGEEFTGYINLEGFPTRSQFTALNDWQPPQSPNRYSALIRSRQVSSSGMNLLQSTKIRMRLRNLNLTMLIKSGSII